MAWNPLGIFKSAASPSSPTDSGQNNSSIASTENTVRPLFINPSLKKAFHEMSEASDKAVTGSKKK